MKPIALYWWASRDPQITNVGDALSPLIVEAIAGRAVEYAPVDACDLIAIGSIMEIALGAHRQTPLAVWGSGFITDGPQVAETRLRYAAVRGPLSASRVPGAGAMGDPALLVDRLLTPHVSRCTPIGLVPHYRDLDHPVVTALQSESGPHRVISPLLPPMEFLAAVAACHFVLSSSLHGLVVADAFGVPNVWIELGDRIIGAGYKYRDYLGAFGIGEVAPLRVVHPGQVSASLAETISTGYGRPGIDAVRAALIASFPMVG